MEMRTNESVIPAIEGLKYAISRFDAFSTEGYGEYPLGTWEQLKVPLQDTLFFLEEGSIQEALTSISLLRSFDVSQLTLELQQCLKPFEYLEKGLYLLVSGDEENAFLALSDFWLTQQHFWHTNALYLPFIPLENRKRTLRLDKVFLRYSRTVVTYFHVLLFALVVAAAIYAVSTEPRTWVGVVTCGLVVAFNVYITSTFSTPAVIARLGFLGIFLVEGAISTFIAIPALSTHNSFTEMLLYVAAGFAFAGISVPFLIAPLGWGRYMRNVERLDLFSCYWVHSLDAKECEVIVTDDSGKIIQRRTVKHPEDVIDEVCAGAVAEMCKPGYGASGPLSRKETSVWYKYYPRISSLRYVKRHDKTSAKMCFRFLPGWFLRYRKWSPFVFTDDAFLSTPGLTVEALAEYFASNPPCCEPPGYEEFVASQGVEAQ